MICAIRKLRPPLKRHGGKAYLARRIIALFPSHRVYCEPFLGGGSVLLNKPACEAEWAGDIEAGLVNLWEAIRDDDGFFAEVETTRYEAANFAQAKAIDGDEGLSRRQCTWAYLVRNRMSRGGLGKAFAWSERLRGKHRAGGPVPGDVNGWETILAELPAIRERIMNVGFRCGPAPDLMREADGPDTLHYLDPPYLPETRTARRVYAHEMTRGDHAELLSAALALKGNVFISGYREPMYDNMLQSWRRHEFDMPNHSSQAKTKQRRIECVWEKP